MIPVLLFLAFLVLYLATLTRCHIYADDSIAWVLKVEKGAYVHPHHILYLLVCRVVFVAARLLGLAERPLVPMQAFSAFLGALGLAAFYRVLRRLGGSVGQALATTLALAFTFGYWGYAITPDVYAPATAGLIFGAAVLFGAMAEGPRASHALLLALFLIFAVGNHQAAILFYPIAVLGLLLARGRFGARLRAVVLFSVVAGGILIALYVLAWRILPRPEHSFADLRAFTLRYLEGMKMLPGEKAFVPSSIPRAFAGLSQAIASANFLFLWDPVYAKAQALLPLKYLVDDRFLVRNLGGAGLLAVAASLAVFAVTLLGLLLARLRNLPPLFRRPEFLVALAWLLLQSAFFTWWEAGSNEFWISTLVPLLLVLHLWIFGKGAGARTLVAASLLGPALLVANGLGAILPLQDPRNDYWLVNKGYLAEVAPRDAVVCYDTYIPNQAARYHSKATIVNLFSGPGSTVDRDEVFATLDAAVARGGRIWLDPRSVRPDRVTLAIEKYYAPGELERYPSLLAEVRERYRASLVEPPLAAPGIDDPPPIE